MDESIGTSQSDDDKTEELIERRTKSFVELFDKMDASGIDLSGTEATIIARTATNQIDVKEINRVSDLSDVKVELLSEYEFKRILERARTAIKQVIEMRKKFSPILKDGKPTGKVAGPFYTNRKMRKAQEKRNRKRVPKIAL